MKRQVFTKVGEIDVGHYRDARDPEDFTVTNVNWTADDEFIEAVDGEALYVMSEEESRCALTLDIAIILLVTVVVLLSLAAAVMGV
jgi:hypothetical protein